MYLQLNELSLHEINSLLFPIVNCYLIFMQIAYSYYYCFSLILLHMLFLLLLLLIFDN